MQCRDIKHNALHSQEITKQKEGKKEKNKPAAFFKFYSEPDTPFLGFESLLVQCFGLKKKKKKKKNHFSLLQLPIPITNIRKIVFLFNGRFTNVHFKKIKKLPHILEVLK